MMPKSQMESLYHIQKYSQNGSIAYFSCSCYYYYFHFLLTMLHSFRNEAIPMVPYKGKTHIHNDSSEFLSKRCDHQFNSQCYQVPYGIILTFLVSTRNLHKSQQQKTESKLRRSWQSPYRAASNYSSLFPVTEISLCHCRLWFFAISFWQLQFFFQKNTLPGSMDSSYTGTLESGLMMSKLRHIYLLCPGSNVA